MPRHSHLVLWLSRNTQERKSNIRKFLVARLLINPAWALYINVGHNLVKLVLLQLEHHPTNISPSLPSYRHRWAALQLLLALWRGGRVSSVGHHPACRRDQDAHASEAGVFLQHPAHHPHYHQRRRPSQFFCRLCPQSDSKDSNGVVHLGLLRACECFCVDCMWGGFARVNTVK